MTISHPASLTHLAQPFELLREDRQDRGVLVIVDIERFSGLEPRQGQWLHAEELAYYQSLTALRRQQSYLLGRVAAKLSLQLVSHERDASNILIQTGIFKDPILQYPTTPAQSIGITHCQSGASAIAYPATHPMAVDMEDLDPSRLEVMKTQCQQEEIEACQAQDIPLDHSYALLWTAKEALSKGIRTGMTCPLRLMGLQTVERHPDGGYRGLFEHFAQYQYRTWIQGDRVLTLVLPKRTRILFQQGAPEITRTDFDDCNS